MEAYKINYQANISMVRATAIQVHEEVLGADSLDLGYPMPEPGAAKGIEAKIRIAHVLGIKINSVEQFKRKKGLK